MNRSTYPQLNDRDWLLARYAECQNTTTIASEVGCDAGAVRRALRRFGVQVRQGGLSRHPTQLDDAAWLTERIGRQTLAEIAVELGCSRPTVRAALARHGIPLPRRSGAPVPELADAEWCRQQIQDKPMRLIASELGCSYLAVRTAMERHGIPIPPRRKYRMTVDKSPAVKAGLRKRYPNGRRGELASNWKGGRVPTKAGYVLIYAPDHPRAKAGGRTHVQEHILVMERKLGRYLEPGERVEHDDGVRNNNHPDNLYLMGSDAEHIRQHFGYGKETRRLRAENARLRAALEAHGVKCDDENSPPN